MKFFGTYWATLIGMVADTSTYKEIVKKTLRFSVMFFLFSALLFSVYEALLFRFAVFPKIVQFTQPEIQTAVEQLSANATINVTNGKLETTEIETPFQIGLSKEGQDFFGAEYLLTFQDPGPQNALIDLTQEQVTLAIPNQDSSQVVRFSDLEIPDFSWTKDDVQTKTNEFFQALPAVATVGATFLVLATWLGLLFWVGLVNVLYGYASVFLAWAFGISLTFNKAYQLGLHVAVLALFVEEVGRLIAGNFSHSLFTASYFLIMLFVLFSLRPIKYNTVV